MTHDPDNCKEVFAMLSQYLDLDLPPDACAEVERHLAGCVRCVEFVESLRKTIALCRTYQPDTMPAALTAQARADLEGAWRRMLARRSERSTS
jgi:RNA polymerase sigma-70 factor (ECF subfamily)